MLAAAVVVLTANGWGVWQAVQNRTESRGGALRLTEREIPLQDIGFESSVTVLRLNWKTDGKEGDRRHAPAWLDDKKLAELGFDCHLPLDDPKARRHYSSKPARYVFLVLECRADTDSTSAPDRPGRNNTGLVVIDAALDPQQLRKRYPDPDKHIISRGLVRLIYRRYGDNGAAESPPRLEGWVDTLCPAQLSVSKPTNRLLTKKNHPTTEGQGPARQVHFTGRVCWGRNYEPWVEQIQPVSK
jgi:hypothetical protein